MTPAEADAEARIEAEIDRRDQVDEHAGLDRYERHIGDER